MGANKQRSERKRTGQQESKICCPSTQCHNLSSPSFSKAVTISAFQSTLIVWWDDEWANEQKGKLTKQFFPSIRDAAIMQKGIIHHQMTQILTGHCKLNYHQHKIKKSLLIKMCLRSRWRNDTSPPFQLHYLRQPKRATHRYLRKAVLSFSTTTGALLKA